MISDTIGMSDYYSSQYHDLQIQFGSGAMVSIIFNVYKFGITVGFFDRTWKL